jgi:hypothetical protein
MKNKSKGILIAEEGYQKYKKNNTWKHRVDDLYKVLEKIHFSQSSKVCA